MIQWYDEYELEENSRWFIYNDAFMDSLLIRLLGKFNIIDFSHFFCYCCVRGIKELRKAMKDEQKKKEISNWIHAQLIFTSSRIIYNI